MTALLPASWQLIESRHKGTKAQGLIASLPRCLIALFLWSSLLIAVSIGGSVLPVMSQDPWPVSALVKIDLGAEGDLQRM